MNINLLCGIVSRMDQAVSVWQNVVHNGFRWVVVVLALLTLLSHLYGLITHDKYGDAHSSLFKWLNISLAIQLLIGIAVLLGKSITVEGYGESLGVVLGHAITAIVAIAAVGITSSRIRKTNGDRAKFLTGTIGLLIASALIWLAVSALPYSAWAFDFSV